MSHVVLLAFQATGSLSLRMAKDPVEHDTTKAVLHACPGLLIALYSCTADQFDAIALSQVPVLMSKRTGAQQPHINKGEVDNILLVIPEENVLTKYYEFTNSIYEAITNNKLEYSDLTSLRDWLFPMLMNGQVIANTEVAAI